MNVLGAIFFTFLIVVGTLIMIATKLIAIKNETDLLVLVGILLLAFALLAVTGDDSS
jgi:Ca2+/Na+ antiporter